MPIGRSKKLPRTSVQSKPIMIIAHGDVDGVISAVIAARSLSLNDRDDVEYYFSGPRSIDNVLSRIPGGGKRLIIVDIAINPDKLDKIRKQIKRLSKSGWQITWIDHHEWPPNALDGLSMYADVRVRRAPSAARVVLEDLSGSDYEKELAVIADDADTATYSNNRARMYNSLTRDRKKREYLLKVLLEGKFEDDRVIKWATKRIREQEKAMRIGIKGSIIEKTNKGRSFAIIDLRPRGGPGSLISKKLANDKGVGFSLVIYSCDKFSLYAGMDKSANLKPICENHSGGGHPYACGARIDIPYYKKLICLLLGRMYLPREIRELTEEIKQEL